MGILLLLHYICSIIQVRGYATLLWQHRHGSKGGVAMVLLIKRCFSGGLCDICVTGLVVSQYCGGEIIDEVI